jgi:hypothetical protein
MGGPLAARRHVEPLGNNRIENIRLAEKVGSCDHLSEFGILKDAILRELVDTTAPKGPLKLRAITQGSFLPGSQTFEPISFDGCVDMKLEALP